MNVEVIQFYVFKNNSVCNQLPLSIIAPPLAAGRRLYNVVVHASPCHNGYNFVAVLV